MNGRGFSHLIQSFPWQKRQILLYIRLEIFYLLVGIKTEALRKNKEDSVVCEQNPRCWCFGTIVSPKIEALRNATLREVSMGLTLIMSARSPAKPLRLKSKVAKF